MSHEQIGFAICDKKKWKKIRPLRGLSKATAIKVLSYYDDQP